LLNECGRVADVRRQAFKNYDEAGNQRRIQCLKYLVLANMLMESQVDPFDAQEAKPYKVLSPPSHLLARLASTPAVACAFSPLRSSKPCRTDSQPLRRGNASWTPPSAPLPFGVRKTEPARIALADAGAAGQAQSDPEVEAMTSLVGAYQRNAIMDFEKILKNNRRTIMEDAFIRNYMEDLLKNIRTQVLLKLILPYTRIRIPFISQVRRAVSASASSASASSASASALRGTRVAQVE
jgi:hypothetical protein